MRDIIEEKQRLRESEEQLRQLAARVQTAREEERANLARELHDELGQTLTAIKLELGRTASALRKRSRRRPDGRSRPVADRPRRDRPRDGQADRHEPAAGDARSPGAGGGDALGSFRVPRLDRDTLLRAGGPRIDRVERRAADGGVPHLPGGVDQRRAARACQRRTRHARRAARELSSCASATTAAASRTPT